MRTYYFDSCAIVKLLVVEEGSSEAVHYWTTCQSRFASRLLHPEVCAALGAAHRNHQLDSATLEQTLHLWDQIWANMHVIELTAKVMQHASELAVEHCLRGADSIHLESAASLPQVGVSIVTWDKRLAAGAKAHGLDVLPA